MRICPTCNKPAEWENNPDRPFCSERCRLIDFGHWVDEDYRVPTRDDSSQQMEYETEDETIAPYIN